MVESLEVAAFATHIAETGKSTIFMDLRIEPVINFGYLSQESGVGFATCHHFFFFFCHKGTRTLRLTFFSLRPDIEIRISYLSFVTLCLRGYFFVLFDSFYFLELVEPAVVNAGAFLSGFIPRVGAFQIAWPKWPASALLWSDGINNTIFSASGFSQEYAVFSVRLFDNCCPETDTL